MDTRLNIQGESARFGGELAMVEIKSHPFYRYCNNPNETFKTECEGYKNESLCKSTAKAGACKYYNPFGSRWKCLVCKCKCEIIINCNRNDTPNCGCLFNGDLGALWMQI
jgi:hypothetical protein